MGNIILPNGSATWSDHISGSINLSELENDLCSTDYTENYKRLIIKSLIDLLT